MESYMFKLLCQMKIEDAIEMSRELRELSEMSESELDLYTLLHPDAAIFSSCSKETIISSREEVLMILN